ncbi:DNA polymerase beta domain protein region [Pyrolobus fumarii 1A]|uniref:DNA polymerase beta domain protein region n=1 Tax=Pyrolobus fumarii (strain DSM 11204 / 1A) TaxID=694429 RepID=G0ED74_PYRF1|nr:amino acid permease [Pyrolobus fumarii]AEM39752.1 DNA polymerase beta domain protein region [Pyrolobus fumarii 1A]
MRALSEKKIGFIEAFSIGVGGMIGGGIFAVLGLTLELARGAAPLAFLFAGLVALITAYSYAKLSVRYPSEGGTVEFIVRAFGRSFISGWLNILLLASYVIMLALYAYAFGSYASGLFLGGENWWTRTGFAWIIIAFFTLLNALGAYVVGKVEDVLVLFKVGVLLLFSGIGLIMGNPERLSPVNWPPLLNVLVGGLVIFLAYEGFELIANASKDVYEPERTIPRALYASVIFVMMVYMLTAAAAAENLTPEEVQLYRDYALAVAAKPVLGEIGFVLIGLAALVSTSSAINATLYGTARISYVVAKLGQLPRIVGRRVWGRATEGLVIISLASAVAVAALPLEAIGIAGSLGFLTIYAAVNLANYRLRRYTRANPVLALLGVAVCTASAIILVANSLPHPEYIVGAVVVFLYTAIMEGLVRTGEKLKEYIDEELMQREKLVMEVDRWLPRVVERIVARHPDARVYLVGSVARGELHQAHDVDVLVVTERPPRGRERMEMQEVVAKEAGLPPRHPLHLHYATPTEEKKWLEKARRYRRLR